MRTLLLSLFLSIPSFAADPISPPTATPPVMVELSKVKAEPAREADPVTIDVGKSRFYKVNNYEGPLTYELAGKSIIIKEIEKAVVLGLVKQGETLPTWDDVAAGSVVLYAVEPGPAELSAWGIVNGKPKKILTKTFTVPGAVPPAPKPPIIPPGPTPIIPPVPVPTPTAADAELVKKLQAAIALDTKEYDRWKGAGLATLPEAIRAMSTAYTEGHAILSIGDKNLIPSTWGEIVERMNGLSMAKSVPRLPALENVRRVVGDYVGKRDTAAAVDGTMLDDLAKKFPTVSASLKESVK